MRDFAIIFIHLLVTIARLPGPGGAQSVVAESLLVKHQLLFVNRSRVRAPVVRPTDRVIVGLGAIFMRPARLLRSAIVLKPATILSFHRSMVKRKYSLLFTPKTRGINLKISIQSRIERSFRSLASARSKKPSIPAMIFHGCFAACNMGGRVQSETHAQHMANLVGPALRARGHDVQAVDGSDVGGYQRILFTKDPSLSVPKYSAESIAEGHPVNGVYRAGSDHLKDGHAVG